MVGLGDDGDGASLIQRHQFVDGGPGADAHEQVLFGAVGGVRRVAQVGQGPGAGQGGLVEHQKVQGGGGEGAPGRVVHVVGDAHTVSHAGLGEVDGIDEGTSRRGYREIGAGLLPYSYGGRGKRHAAGSPDAIAQVGKTVG